MSLAEILLPWTSEGAAEPPGGGTAQRGQNADQGTRPSYSQSQGQQEKKDGEGQKIETTL